MDRSRFIVFVGHNVPSTAAEKHLMTVITKLKEAEGLEFTIDTIEMSQPRTSYAFIRSKAGEAKSGVQKCWEFKIALDKTAPEALGGSSMWCQPCRPMEEREHRRTLNIARRFLHGERERAKIGAKAMEHGVELPVIGGKYYPVAKANVCW